MTSELTLIAESLRDIALAMSRNREEKELEEDRKTKRVRNERARCMNCLYSKPLVSTLRPAVLKPCKALFTCCFEHPDSEHGFPVMDETDVCGRHPDFWKEEA